MADNNQRNAVVLAQLIEILDDNEEIDIDSDEEDVIPRLVALGALKRCMVPRVRDFAEDIIEHYTSWDFKQNFRISRQTFERIRDQLAPQLQQDNVRGKDPISPSKQILIFLWYLCNECSIREISTLFGISTSTVHGILDKVSKALVGLMGQFIKMPDNDNQIEISQSFEHLFHVRNCIGAIDGTHIRLSNTLNGDDDYINRKGFPSINLQLVTDDRLLIRDAYVGWPGCSHDARVYRNSPLCAALQAGHLVQPDFFIIGDAAYPNSPCLVTPFRDNGQLTEQQRFYNQKISTCRQVVERAIGILKGRFRRLKNIYCHDAELVCNYIIAACVLHNMCILADDDIQDMFVHDDNHPNNYPPFQRGGAFPRRDALVQ